MILSIINKHTTQHASKLIVVQPPQPPHSKMRSLALPSVLTESIPSPPGSKVQGNIRNSCFFRALALAGNSTSADESHSYLRRTRRSLTVKHEPQYTYTPTPIHPVLTIRHTQIQCDASSFVVAIDWRPSLCPLVPHRA
jgi:hypothetical protein